MPLSVLHRNYNMTDPELCMFVSNLVGLMLRDATEFITRGIIAGDITDLQALGNAFEVFPDDGVLQSNVSIAVEDKESAREALMISAKEVYDRALNKWGDKSARYKSFGAFGIVSLSDLAFLFVARRVHKQGTLYLTELSDQGLTQMILDDLDNKAEAFEIALNAIKDAETVRDMKTEERIEKGNELYSFVSKYCEIGKQIWENVSEAKYNDYVIYKTEGGLPGKVLNMAYDTGAGVLSWDVPQSPDPIDKYELERSTDESNWTVVYNGAANEAQVSLVSGANYFRCRAHNKKGWGGWSATLEVNVGGIAAPEWLTAVYVPAPFPIPTPPPKILPAHVLLEWANVAEATMYEVWRSVVEPGAPAGVFTILDEHGSELYYDFEVTLNKRNYYYIVAKNATDRSAPSVEAWAEVME